MPLLSGAMGARRFLVQNGPASIRHELLLDSLQEAAFREPPSAARGGENMGWVSHGNLVGTEFAHEDTFYNQYMCFSLRVDNKRLPAKLLKGLLDLRIAAWKAETGRERCSSQIKTEIREQLELELYPKQLPSVQVYDICWDLSNHRLWLFSNSDRVSEKVRELFYRTFGYFLLPVGLVELVAGHERAGEWLPALDGIGHADYRPEASR